MSDHNTDASEPNPNGLSTSSLPAKAITGRVVVELDANGKLWMEFYTNGMRTRTLLDRGNEWWQVVDELSMQRKHSASAAERAAAKLDEQARKRHRQVWVHAAEANGQGVDFAKNTIGGEVPVGYGKYFAPAKAPAKTKASPESKATDPNVVNQMDLI